MDVRMLSYFVLVAEEGSIHGGARRAHVAQPAVSVALKKLEREMGRALLTRSPQGVELTPAGTALLGNARRILRSLDEARDEVLGGRRTFTVGLCAGLVAAGELTGPILSAFQLENPDLTVRVRDLDFVEQFDAVRDGIVDVAVVRSPYDHDDLEMEPLFSEPSVLVTSAEHPLARRDEVALGDALDATYLEIVSTPPCWRDFWNFAELRSSRNRPIPSDAVRLFDYSLDVVKHVAVSPMALSCWRLGGLRSPSMSALRLVDAPHSVSGIGVRRGERRREVASFVSTARGVARELISLVPSGELHPLAARG